MKGLYFDYAATTPVDPRVLTAMLPYMSEEFGNPGSLHSFGQKASAAVFRSRQMVAHAIGAQYPEIIFTGSATEANNLALGGVMRRYVREQVKAKAKNPMPRLIISAIEHESIMATAKDLARDGADVVIIPVSKDGIVDVKKIKAALNERTALVSIMAANNEVGTIQPVQEIAAIVKEFRGKRAWPLMHTDASQSFQYLETDVEEMSVDLMTLSSQKIYGPKGIGALYVKTKMKGVNRLYPIDAILTGGGQEQGLRSGTENVPGIVGFAKAVEIAAEMRAVEAARLLTLRNELFSRLKKSWPAAVLNGSRTERLPNNLNIFFPEFTGEQLIVALDLLGIAVSVGPACSARSVDPSPTLTAMKLPIARAKNSVRISLGRATDKKSIDTLVAAFLKLKRSKIK